MTEPKKRFEPEPTWLTIYQVASRLQASASTVRRLYHNGHFPKPTTIGLRLKRWRLDVVEAWEREHLPAAAAEEQTEQRT
jgi:excisionase family DNA binding protein